MKYTWQAKDESGKEVTLRFDGTALEVVAPQPKPDLTEAKGIFSASGVYREIDGINIPRAKNDLVVYDNRAIYSTVNRWGVDLLIERGTNRVLDMRDREETDAAAFPFALTEVILSGHGETAQWLRDNVKKGDVLTPVLTPQVPVLDPVPDPTPTPVGGSNNCSIWVLLWPNSPRVDIANLASEVDEIRLAFAINDGKLVGYGPYGGKEQLGSLLRTFLSQRKGRRISVSVGGGGYTIVISDVNAYADNILKIGDDLGVPIMGINWDWESRAFRVDAARCVAVSRRLKTLKGKDFFVSWSPNGEFKDDYRNALKNAADVVDEISQQFYDSVVTYDAALTEVRKYVALFGVERVGVGMGLGPDAKHWDVSECKDYMTRLRAATGVRITNLWWEGSTSLTNEWAAAMKKVTS